MLMEPFATMCFQKNNSIIVLRFVEISNVFVEDGKKIFKMIILELF